MTMTVILHTSKPASVPITVFVDKITMIIPEEAGSCLGFVGADSMSVVEKPDEIMELIKEKIMLIEEAGYDGF